MMYKIIRGVVRFCASNIIVNNLAIKLNFESKLKNIDKYWNEFMLDSSKSLQENVGFSHRPDVEEALAKTHKDLVTTADRYLSEGQHILDVGCGTGLYLKEFDRNKYRLFGIDMSNQMIAAAKQHLPHVHLVVGNFMKYNFDMKFNYIYSVSVLEYVSRTELSLFFKKLSDLLESNGIIFIHYPHALSFYDLLYPDLNYIKYSPSVAAKAASNYFTILSHKHGYDDRTVTTYDMHAYHSLNGTFKNGYLLIARKK